MKKFCAVLSLISFGSFAHASQVTCTGQYWGYQFAMSAQVSNNQVSGNMAIIVSQNGSVVKTISMAPTSSDVRAGQYIHMTGSSSEGNGQMTANFTGGTTYSGTMLAHVGFASVNVPVRCNLSEADFQ